MKLSIVSPIYKAEKILPLLVERIEKSISNITDDYEIILVEDCSPDNSWTEIERINQNNSKVIGIKLSRNFGQHYAITAGLDHCTGDWIVVMDCDLQDQPEEIIKLYTKTQEGYDIVLASRVKRQDSYYRIKISKLFYNILAYLTGTKQDSTIVNFGIYNKKVINVITSMRESIRFFPTMIKWVGFKSTKIKVEHADRTEGKSTYNFKKMLNLALDVILAFSDKPLRLTIKLGFIVSFVSILLSIYTLFKWLNGQIIVIGYSSLMISIWFLSGCILITLGIVGLYIGKIFEGVKNRPLYIIEKKI